MSVAAEHRFDVVVIGTGPGGEGAAMQASKNGLSVAVIERDIIVVQNLVLFYAVIFVAVNVLVDLSYAWLDPRIRFG